MFSTTVVGGGVFQKLWPQSVLLISMASFFLCDVLKRRSKSLQQHVFVKGSVFKLLWHIQAHHQHPLFDYLFVNFSLAALWQAVFPVIHLLIL